MKDHLIQLLLLILQGQTEQADDAQRTDLSPN